MAKKKYKKTTAGSKRSRSSGYARKQSKSNGRSKRTKRTSAPTVRIVVEQVAAGTSPSTAATTKQYRKAPF